MALFSTNSRGSFLKPSEGISTMACNTLAPSLRGGGFWMWVCNSKVTDSNGKGSKDKNSRIYGAVFVAEIMDTRTFKILYSAHAAMKEFKHSRDCDYQMIIPMHPRARRELKTPIAVDAYNKGDQRLGVWEIKDMSKMYEQIRNPVFA
jgi:hypothetical protein